MSKPLPTTLKLACRRATVSTEGKEDGWVVVRLYDVTDDSIVEMSDELCEVLSDVIEQKARDLIEAREEAAIERRHRHD